MELFNRVTPLPYKMYCFEHCSCGRSRGVLRKCYHPVLFEMCPFTQIHLLMDMGAAIAVVSGVFFNLERWDCL